MDTDIVYRLIFIGIGLAMLATGSSIFYLGRYLETPE
jgi:hypothetical protein